MRWDEVAAQTPRVIGPDGHRSYAEDGYLAFPELVVGADLATLRSALSDLIEQSRELDESNHHFDLDAGHTADAPRLRRAACIDDMDPVFWDFCRDSVLVDIAADIMGPNICFRDAFANLKWFGGGAAVEWHQDIAFYPHTNGGTCQFIVALEEVSHENGPLTIVPGSHRGPAYSHYGADGAWTGAIDPPTLVDAGLDQAVEITGLAGTTSVHHGLTLHYSAPNHSNVGRPVLVVTYRAADSIPYTAPPYRSSHYGALVRGVNPGVAHHEELVLTLPPDWTDGYTSIFSHQEVLTDPESDAD
jgi:ectoine hydroxylase